MPLSDRLEIRVPPETLRILRGEADRRGVSVGHIVREAIELLMREDRQARMQAAEALFRIGAPVADWPEMEREIAAGLIQEGSQGGTEGGAGRRTRGRARSGA